MNMLCDKQYQREIKNEYKKAKEKERWKRRRRRRRRNKNALHKKLIFNYIDCYKGYRWATMTLYYECHLINKRNVFEKRQIIFIFIIFFCVHCIAWNWFIAKFILIPSKYLFWHYSKWWGTKLSAPSLNRSLSRNFWWLKSANHVKFPDEYVMCMKKNVLVKNMFTNGLNMCLPFWTGIKKTVHGVETHWFSCKVKVPCTAVSKESHPDSFLAHESTHNLISLKKVQL